MQWLEEEFLPYLEEWQQSVTARNGFSSAQKKRMMLSAETLLGLQITGRPPTLHTPLDIDLYIHYLLHSKVICWSGTLPLFSPGSKREQAGIFEPAHLPGSNREIFWMPKTEGGAPVTIPVHSNSTATLKVYGS